MNRVFISLGLNCSSAVYGTKKNLRKKKENGYNTCPFDLMLSSYSGLIECLNDDFKYFVDPEYLKLVPNLGSPNELVIVNTKYNFCFNHESPGHANLHNIEKWPNGVNHFINNNYKEFQNRYLNRISNFKNYLENKNNYIIFGITKIDPQDNIIVDTNLIELHKIIKIKYPQLKYEIIMI